MNRIIILCFLFYFPFLGNGQVVYQDINKTSIYVFLDEMANLKLIELNTFIKPYSRELIATKLSEIDTNDLNNRQKKELVFFLKDFNKELKPDKNFDKRYDLFYYKDSLFRLTVNPIIGMTYHANENRTNWHRWWGGEVLGTIGKNFGFYFNLRDNSEDTLSQHEDFLNTAPGVVYKGSGDFSDMRGGLIYSWKWGSFGLIKDNFTWGNNNFGSNILSKKAPSFARIEFKIKPTKWFDFTYIHGWLASEVRDSSRSYLAGAKGRNINVKKFIAANIFTITPLKHFNVSLGNSVIYSDEIQPAFLIPFMFFKAVDHTVYSGGGNFGGANTQMFLDISSRNIRGVHLYTTLYVDELSISRMWNSNEHSNFVSWKIGGQWSNILKKNITLTAEYTRTNPITYQHFVNTTTYESNNFNMGHYLRDNAQEFAFGIAFKPIARLRVYTTYILAQKGNEYPYSGVSTDVWGLPFMEEKRWESSSFATDISYQILNDVFVFINYQYREASGKDQSIYTHKMYQGITNTISFGANVGF